MTWLGRTTLGLALALTALLVPATARAVTVDCSNPFGSCEVSNDGEDEVFCDCDNGGTGSTGGMDWTGLSEEELLVVCFDHLEICGPIAETDFGTSTFGTDSVGDTSFGVTTDPTETESATTVGPETESNTTIDPSASTTDHSTSDPTIDPTDSGSTSGDTSGSSGSGSTSDGTTGDDPSTSTDPTTGGPAVTMSGTETNPVETSDGESSGDTGGSDGEGGCSCSTDGTGSPFAAFGLLALLGLRRRRR
jgi:MYXO-CTERM domain-containing protein